MPKPSKPLTIGLVSDDGLDRPDGVQQQMRLLGEWLSRQGHDVHYLVGETNEFKPSKGTLHSLSRNFAIRANQNSLSLPLPGAGRRLRRIMDSVDFDVLHVMLPYSPFLGRAAVREALKRRIGLVGTFHTYPASAWQRLGSRLYGFMLRKQLRRFDRLISVSSPAAEYVRSAFGVNSQVVPNAIDTERFSKPEPDKRLRGGAKTLVIYMNRLDERKGAKYLVLATAMLAPEIKAQLKVLICGRGPLQADLEELIARLGLQDTVELAGFIPESDKPTYLASADIAVYPATGGEAFGIVLLEAMAAGTLTLGGDNPGYRSVLSFAPQTLFEPRDSQQLASCLSEFITDPESAKRLRQQQAQAIKQFDVKLVGQQLEDIYHQSIASKGRF